MRSEAREESPEGNRQREAPPERHQREDSPEERRRPRAEPEREEPPEENNEWDFLDGASEDFEDDEDTSEDTRSDQSGVATQATPRATVFDRLKRKAPEGDESHPPAPKRQPRQGDSLRKIRSAIH